MNTTKEKFRIGIVGLQPGRSWSAVAHLAAIRQLSDTFDIAGVANSTPESSRAAAKACGIPRAFTDVAEMASSPGIDIIVVTVRVPGHLNVVRAALNAGKHVYCEWPLGRNLDEAKEMAELARKKNVLAVSGTQARVNPAIRHLGQLMQDGFVGKLRSSSVSGWGRIWGDRIESLVTDEYLLKRENGTTMLTIPFAHMLAAFQDVLGDIARVSAILETRIPQVYASETGQYVTMDAADQIIVSGHLADNSPLSMHYRGESREGRMVLSGRSMAVKGISG